MDPHLRHGTSRWRSETGKIYPTAIQRSVSEQMGAVSSRFWSEKIGQGSSAQQPVPLVLVRHAFTDVNWVLTPLPMA
jgi:hypothetical protein